jgi:hypothetical protein
MVKDMRKGEGICRGEKPSPGEKVAEHSEVGRGIRAKQ